LFVISPETELFGYFIFFSFMNVFLRYQPKVLVAVAGIAVFSIFTAAYDTEEHPAFHSSEELLQLRSMTGGNLPNGMSDMFMGSGRCAGCHGIDQDIENPPFANVDENGVNVSPAENWRASMMANSARDPMWRAKVAHEVSVNPDHAEELVNKCTSCHAPMGRFEAEYDGIENFTIDMLDSDSLALDGVSCMACHAQQIETVGNFFSGELHYNPDTIWGPVFNISKGDEPMADYVMQNFVGVMPIAHEKFPKSETCAGCHTLITNTADLDGNLTGDTFVEQATYHEWLNSSYNTDDENAQECQTCHMPHLNEGVIVASGYSWLPERQPYAQHTLVGGNSFMLSLLKNNITTLGLTANEEHFQTAIDRTLDNLQNHTAEIAITQLEVDGDTARYKVKITNKAGHKLPSGYPARRAYVEFVMTDENGNEVFHSGKLLPGYEVQGQNEDWEPHYDVITDDIEQVQIYEMVVGDVMGNVTTVLERGYQPIKDNRLVPFGFTTEHASYDTMAVVAVGADPNFNLINGNEGSGTDEISYHIPVSGISGNVTVTARLMYQSLPPKWNEEMFAVDHPVINAFEEMYWQEGPAPVMMVEAQTSSTLVGINSLDALFTISPNPTTSGQVFIDAGSDKINAIDIYDMNGKLVQHIVPNSNRCVAKLPFIQGMYLLDISTARGRKVEKVLRR
jgi:hypothetical protein